MTEREYIMASDLRTVRHMIALLREIVAENNPHTTLDEWRAVYKTLDTWQERLFKAIKVKAS